MTVIIFHIVHDMICERIKMSKNSLTVTLLKARLMHDILPNQWMEVRTLCIFYPIKTLLQYLLILNDIEI